MAAKQKKIQSVLKAEPGYTTTEFWVTVLTDILAVLSVIFHSDFHGVTQYVPLAAIAAAGAGHIIYTVSRTNHKSSAMTCLFELLGQIPSSQVMQLLSNAEVLEPSKKQPPPQP